MCEFGFESISDLIARRNTCGLSMGGIKIKCIDVVRWMVITSGFEFVRERESDFNYNSFHYLEVLT